MKQLLIALPCMALLSLQCHKKDDECPSYDNLPVYDIPTDDLSQNPYYGISQISFVKNSQHQPIIFTLNKIQNEHVKKGAHTPVENGTKCIEYIGNFEEKTLIYTSPDGKLSLQVHQQRSSDTSEDRSLSLYLGEPRTVENLNPFKIVVGGFQMNKLHTNTTLYPVIPEMTVRGKVYHNVFTTVIGYVPFEQHNYKVDSIYYTIDKGIIRAADSEGQVYELVE